MKTYSFRNDLCHYFISMLNPYTYIYLLVIGTYVVTII